MKTILATAAFVALATTTTAATITTTIPDQNYTASAWGAGAATEIFGQSFTLGATTNLGAVDFLINDTGTAMTYNAYIFGWNGQDTSGTALYSGTGSTAGVNGLATVTINAATTLAAGSYIAYLEATSSGFAEFGTVWGNDAYAGGEFLYQDTGGNVTARVATPWVGDVQGPNWDLAFALGTATQVAAVPIAPALPLLASALGALGIAQRRKS